MTKEEIETNLQKIQQIQRAIIDMQSFVEKMKEGVHKNQAGEIDIDFTKGQKDSLTSLYEAKKQEIKDLFDTLA